MMGCLLNILIEKDFGRKRTWCNEVTSRYVSDGNEENHEKPVKETSDPDCHLTREEYQYSGLQQPIYTGH